MPQCTGFPKYGLSHGDMERLLAVAKEAAAEAAALIKECIAKRASMPLHIDAKSHPVDMVTQYDKACEALILRMLKKECDVFNVNRKGVTRDGGKLADVPFAFIGEESYENQTLDDRPTWIIDPIDGTTSFIHGSFDCGVSIGLAVHGVPALGVVNLPLMREVFWAIKGGGAFRNDAPISCSGCTAMTKALVCIHMSYNRSPAAVAALMGVTRDIAQMPVHGIRGYGSAAMDLCSVACGRLDLYFEAGVQAWDMCAGIIIVREAGGIVGPMDRPCTAATQEGAFDLMRQSMVCGATAELVAVAVEVSNKNNYRDSVLNGKEEKCKL